jgi:hypothetical protein
LLPNMEAKVECPHTLLFNRLTTAR